MASCMFLLCSAFSCTNDDAVIESTHSKTNNCFPEVFWSVSLRKLLWFHLISWYGKFVETRNFRRVSKESPETVRKLSISTKFPHQKIRWNFGLLRNVFSRIQYVWRHFSRIKRLSTKCEIFMEWSSWRSQVFYRTYTMKILGNFQKIYTGVCFQ